MRQFILTAGGKVNDQVEQAKLAYQYYIKGRRDHAWDPASRKWVPLSASSGGNAPRTSPPALSARARSRIEAIQEAERDGIISHDAAEAEILTILREET
jgi:hypothetical protein